MIEIKELKKVDADMSSTINAGEHAPEYAAADQAPFIADARVGSEWASLLLPDLSQPKILRYRLIAVVAGYAANASAIMS